MATEQDLDKHRIAKNTLLLYVRMFLMILIGLYASRVILKTLGISDYGVYNVVGGMVSMFAFLNSAMVAASQRFISYELGRGDKKRLNIVFCTSVNIHVIIAVVIFILAETIGLWFVNTQLVIDADRMMAANWVYQFSVLTFMVTVLSVPYNSCIVAHEHMKAFAYIGIVEACLKLAVVFLLLVFSYDKLIFYAFGVFAVSIIVRILYSLYCKRHFEECSYRFMMDRGLLRRMLSFAGWSIFGNLGFSFKDQGSNIILNLFYGTSINAARGISMQVSGLISTFSANFSMALSPQITKQYAGGNIENCLNLVYSGARYTFYLLALVSIPFLINADCILGLWLENVPEYTSIFLKISMIVSVFYTITGTVTTALQATGKIKWFQIGVCVIMLLELPIAYVCLLYGYPPYYALYPGILTSTIAIFFRVFLLKRYIPSCSISYYVFSVYSRCIAIGGLTWILCYYIRSFFPDSFFTVIVTSLVSIVFFISTVFAFGLSGKERTMILNKVKAFVCKSK
ncbi:MATE family efflux transporter [Bacteroides sp. GD17]|uniref:lipopolysaccharide biosynthesis protein n=1 Tax=Bacteroides sp. GD17 TaxID=3139826 RepID=UPI0025FB7213|nr:MATE family efflux transporter [uncultured Bacteroides sp.]